MKPIQVVIPMAGIGSRFKTYGFKKNKYLLPINTDLNPMIETAIDSLGINVPCKYYFIIN
jgi:dTDP-glucose pyrophosphorylase